MLHLAAIFSALLAFFTLYGWYTNNLFLVKMTVYGSPMQPNTSICFLGVACALFALLYSYNRLSIFFTACVMAISIASLVQYVAGVDFGIDRILFEEILYPTKHPGRISPNTATCFTLLGICLILSNLEYKDLRSFAVEVIAGITGSIAIITIFGYILDLPEIIGWLSYPGMSLHGAFAIGAISLSLFLSHSICSYVVGKNFYGPLVSAIILTLYVTFALWEGFKSYEKNTMQTLSQNTANFIAHSLDENIQNVAEAFNRMADRFEINGVDTKIWQSDRANYVRDMKVFENLGIINNRFELIDSVIPIENHKELFASIDQNIGEEPRAVYHFKNGSSLYIFVPFFQSGALEGIIFGEISIAKLVEKSVPAFFNDFYHIEIIEDSNVDVNETVGEAIAFVDSPILDWVIKIKQKNQFKLSSFMPDLILFSGMLSIGFISIAAYLLQQIFRAKAKILNAFKEKEHALAFRQAILDAAAYSIIATDMKGTILSFNKAAERMLQRKSVDMIHKQTPAVFHDEEEIVKRAEQLSEQLGEKVEPGIESFVALARRGRPEEHEWTYIRKDGTRFPVHLSIAGVRNRQNEVIGFVGMAYDLTQVKEIERMKNELIAITTHEIRSPLTSIKGALDLLAKAEGKTNPLLEIARSNSDRLLRLTNDILDLQKMESGKMVFHPKEFNIEELFLKVIEINQMNAHNRGVTLIPPVDIHECMVYADEDRILQVLTNFVSNAIKNAPKNSLVTFEAVRIGDYIRIGVRDRGPGIPQEYHNLIFQKFSQVPGEKKIGTGLGLSICKSIINEHKGKIGFDTSPEGTVFWFELPILQKADQQVVAGASHAEE